MGHPLLRRIVTFWPWWGSNLGPGAPPSLLLPTEPSDCTRRARCGGLMFSVAVSVLFIISGARGGGCPLQVEHHASGGGEWGADMGEEQRGNSGKQEIKIKNTNTNTKRNWKEVDREHVQMLGRGGDQTRVFMLRCWWCCLLCHPNVFGALPGWEGVLGGLGHRAPLGCRGLSLGCRRLLSYVSSVVLVFVGGR